MRFSKKNEDKPLVWWKSQVKTPPFSEKARGEAGYCLRLLQQGVTLGMPHAEPLPIVGRGCGAIRIPDGEHNWRIMYRIDEDAIIIVEVYDKKTRAIPRSVIERCRQRLATYDQVSRS